MKLLNKIPKDKRLHFGYSYIIAFICGLISLMLNMNALQIFYSGFTISCAAGFGKEYGDKINPYNHWDWYDILADVIGAALGIGSILILYMII